MTDINTEFINDRNKELYQEYVKKYRNSGGEVTPKYAPDSPGSIKTKSPKESQIGGDHYKNLVIQPGEYITKNNLGWYEGNVVKYVTRHKFKNGKEDLLKAIHYLELAIEEYYG